MDENLKGWVCLHRKTLENPIVFKDTDYLGVWVYLLLNATHKEINVMFAGKKITLKPGQLITGRKSISAFLNVNESKVKRILKAFENDQQIDRQRSNKNSLITILNWDKYQKDDQQNDQQVTSKRPTSDQQVTTNNNVTMKQCNKGNNIYVANFECIWKIYPRKQDKALAYKAYNARLNDGYSEDELLTATKAYATECKKKDTPREYIKLAKTFFGPNTPFIDYLKAGEENAAQETEAERQQRLADEYNRKYGGM